MVAVECQTLFRFFFWFYVPLIILVLFFRILFSNFFYESNLIKIKYFLLEKYHGP